MDYSEKVTLAYTPEGQWRALKASPGLHAPDLESDLPSRGRFPGGVSLAFSSRLINLLSLVHLQATLKWACTLLMSVTLFLSNPVWIKWLLRELQCLLGSEGKNLVSWVEKHASIIVFSFLVCLSFKNHEEQLCVCCSLWICPTPGVPGA